MDKEKRIVLIKGKNIEYFVIKKKIKNMNMRLSDSGEIIISIPRYVSLQKAEDFLVSKYSWIEKQKKKYDKYSGLKESKLFIDNDFLYFLGKGYYLRIIPGKDNYFCLNGEYIDIYVKERYLNNKEYIKKVYDEWMKKYCFDLCNKYIAKYQEQMKDNNVPKDITVEIRKYKAKWGACTPSKKKVSFNMNLIKTPVECLEYVVVHELAHFKYLNHSQKFYKLIEKYIPDWKYRKKLLNEKYGRVLI